jgi:hypothetical protein
MALTADGKEIIPGQQQRTRWDEMMERAHQIVSNLPLESTVWICSFNGYPRTGEVAKEDVFRIREFPLATEDDRQVIRKYLDNRNIDGVGTPVGGTALFDAMDIAFQQALRYASDTAGNYVTVYFYTDGKDEGSRNVKSLEELESKYSKYLTNSEKLKWYQFQIGSLAPTLMQGARPGDSAKTPLVLHLATSKYILPNPLDESKPKILLRFLENAKTLEPEAARLLSFRFESTGEKPIQLKADNISLGSGNLEVPLEVSDGQNLQPNVGYSGRLLLEIDSSPTREILLQPSYVDISFRRGNQLEILELQPRNGSVWPIGQPVPFSLLTSPGTYVVWDFGEGRTVEGTKASFVWQTEGKKKVSVKVRGGKSDLPVERTIEIDLVNLPISISQPQEPLFLDEPLQLNGEASPRLSRLEWSINGQAYPATVRQDGGRSLASLKQSVPFAGQFDVQLIGYTDAVKQGNDASLANRLIASPKMNLQVYEPIKIAIQGSRLVRVGTPTQFNLVAPRSDLRTTQWDFDQGELSSPERRQTGNQISDTDTPVFTFQQSGNYTYGVQVRWKDGRTKNLRESIQIIADSPKAKIGLEKTGNRIFINRSLALLDQSTGDITGGVWEIELPDGTKEQLTRGNTSFTPTMIGRHVVRLNVDGFYNRDDNQTPKDVAELLVEVVPPPPYLTFSLLCFGGIILWGIVTRFAFGNYPKDWKFAKGSDTLPVDKNVLRNFFRSHVKLRLGKNKHFRWTTWTLLKKKGYLPVKAIKPTDFFTRGNGKEAEFEIYDGTVGAVVRYSRNNGQVSVSKEAISQYELLTVVNDRESDERTDHHFWFLIDTNPKHQRLLTRLAPWLISFSALTFVLYVIVNFYNNYIR